MVYGNTGIKNSSPLQPERNRKLFLSDAQPSMPDNYIVTQKRENINNNYNIDIFEEVKSRLDILSVIEYYGIALNRKGVALCPFHRERTPSFRVFRESNSYYCFGCGSGGGVIDFVMKLWSVDAITAVKRIDTDFLLNLPLGKRLTKAEYRQAQIEAEKRERDKKLVKKFEEWQDKAVLLLTLRFRELHERSFNILNSDNPRLQKHISELAEKDFVEYLLDEMIKYKSDFKHQVEFWKTFKGVIERYERLYNEC